MGAVARGILGAGVLICLPGCLDYRESLKLKADGSGSIIVAYGELEDFEGLDLGIPSAAPKLTISEAQAKAEGVKGVEFVRLRQFEENDTVYHGAEYRFEDLKNLRELFEKERYVSPSYTPSEEEISDQIDFYEDMRFDSRGGRFIFYRKIDPIPLQKAEELEDMNDLMAQSMASSMLAGYRLKFEVTFPGRVLKANSPRIDHAERKVTWNFGLDQLQSREGLVMRAEIEDLGNSPMYFFGAGVIVALSGVMGGAIFLGARSRRLAGEARAWREAQARKQTLPRRPSPEPGAP